jgi:hypothetical protein
VTIRTTEQEITSVHDTVELREKCSNRQIKQILIEDPVSLLHISFSCVEIILHTKFQLPRLPGSGRFIVGESQLACYELIPIIKLPKTGFIFKV